MMYFYFCGLIVSINQEKTIDILYYIHMVKTSARAAPNFVTLTYSSLLSRTSELLKIEIFHQRQHVLSLLNVNLSIYILEVTQFKLNLRGFKKQLAHVSAFCHSPSLIPWSIKGIVSAEGFLIQYIHTLYKPARDCRIFELLRVLLALQLYVGVFITTSLCSYYVHEIFQLFDFSNSNIISILKNGP